MECCYYITNLPPQLPHTYYYVENDKIKSRQLNLFQRIFRNLFGCYKETHTSGVCAKTAQLLLAGKLNGEEQQSAACKILQLRGQKVCIGEIEAEGKKFPVRIAVNPIDRSVDTIRHVMFWVPHKIDPRYSQASITENIETKIITPQGDPEIVKVLREKFRLKQPPAELVDGWDLNIDLKGNFTMPPHRWDEL